ncbi:MULTISPECIES: DUF2155 domain-containing protein [Martelella]|uniref:DUF2155 domain-containing protein n=2 Tax=Martelella TaxID=293088 RepID=A0A7T7HM94_9HYPH|nr:MULTISPECIES: DUF2155 domain-containing protein [Martelella]MBB4122260.1 hypothetical protein [Martelella radicis]QQM31826.1 DUF2155 domain-containing protein [Martelella lutilitoris]
MDFRALSRLITLSLGLAATGLVAGPALAARVENPVAVFGGIDKITGRTYTFDAYVGETVQFGRLQVTPRVCYSRDETEEQQVDAFVQVDKVSLQNEVSRIFSGWMFADSPALNAVEDPIYDVWLTDCVSEASIPAP